ncbi:MAG: hypothetical protein HYT85_10100 [candidate division NC10 bacterium]|nr:hypothetical protein [candidate division NC10 bacterium]
MQTPRRTRGEPLLWILPSALALFLLILIPAAFLLYVSLTGYELGFPGATGPSSAWATTGI